MAISKLLVIALAFHFILIPIPTQAASAPEEFILNHETKQCGGYWYGDEFGQNEFPKGWTRYAIKNIKYGEEYKLTVETEIGNCSYSDQESFNYKDCCSKLGYKYVSDRVEVETENENNNEEYPEKSSDNFFMRFINFLFGLFN